MKKLFSLIFLLTFSLGYSQGLSQGFESGGINGAPFASGAAPTVTREAGPGTNSTQVVKFIGSTGSADWQGVNISLTTNVNLTASTTRTMSIDVYASGPLFFLVKVNGGLSGAPEAAAVVEYTGTNTWQTCSFTFNSVRDGKAAAANGTYAGFVLHPYWPSAVATSFNLTNPTARTLYVDNIVGPLALTSATVGTFTIASKLVGDANFTITPPTSNNTSAFTYSSSNNTVATIVSGNQIQVGSIGSTTITAAQVSDGTYAATSTTATFNVVPAAAPTPPVRVATDVVSVFSDAYTVGVTSPAFGASTAVNAGGTDAARLYTGSNNGVLSFTSTTVAAGMTHLHMDIFSTTASAAQMLIQINGVNSSNRLTPNGVWTSLDIPVSAWAAGFGASLSSIGILPYAGSGDFYVDNVYFYRLPLLTGNMYINDGTFAAGDFCTAAGQDIDANDGTAAKPFATLAYAMTRSSQAAGTVFYVDAGTYSWPATHTFTASGTIGNPITIQGKGSTTNITSTTSTNSGLYFNTGSNWVVKDLNWTATNARSVWVETATGISLENCTFNFTSASASLQSIIIGNAAGKLTIKNCTLTRNNTAFHMIEVVAGTSLTLQDNTIRFSAVVAVGTAASVLVTANAASVLIMERNKLYGGGYGVGFVAAGTIAANASTIIKNNFFSSNWGIVNTQLTGLKVYNNSFYTADNCLYGITPAFMNNWDIQNNILYTYGAAACVFVNATTAAAMNYNHYYYPNGTGAVNLNGTTSSLATWKASANPLAIREANGQGGSVTANNPLYTNIASLATNDLHIQSASPTIGVGSNVGVTDDIDGNARPLGGTYDLGADESVPGTPAITNFPAIAKVMGDAPFNVTQPTSNSTGAWTYSITVGNNTVATISGTTVTLVAAGTATIRATQAADGTYIEGFIEATLTVTPSPFPLTGAPGDPGKNSWDVISLFSSDYTDLAGTNFNPNWGQAATTANGSLVYPNNMTTPSYGSNAVKQYQNSGNYQGTASAASIDISAMTRFHIEIYSTTLTSIRVSLIKTAGGTVEVPTTLALTPNQWNVFNIDISGAPFSAVRPVFLEIKYDSPAGAGNIQNLIVDNLFFWRPATTLPPTLGAFTVPAKVIGDAAFALTPPTSNSAGAFTYTSSNTAVATVSGDVVTIVGVGTSTITATQAAAGSYGSGSTTATLSVTPPAATTPPVRNAWDVVSFYSGAYSNSSTPTWGGSTNSDISIGGNTTRLFSSGYTNGQIAFAATNLSAMTHLHVDVYSVNLTPMWFYLGAKRINVTTPATGWTTLDIPLSDFTSSPTGAAINLNSINLFKTENPNGAVAPPRIIYLDNIYFYRAATDAPPTLGALTVPSPKIFGDAPFTLTDPTSNSSGTWTYSASPADVVTISGNTVTIVGGGTTTITATQAAVPGVYGPGTASASLVVNYPAPVASPIPPARDPSCVVSLYTGNPTTYANVSAAVQASWSTGSTNSNFSFANGTDTCIQVNNLGFFGLVGNTNFSVLGMTKLHVDIYVNTPMTTMILNLLAPSDRNYSIGPLTTGWNSFDIPLTIYPGALTDIAGIKFEQSGGTARQIYIDNVYFYKTANWSGTTSTNWATASNWAEGSAPTSTSDVVIASSANQPIIGSDVTINSLAISTGATLTVNSGYNLTVTNAVANSGTMTLQNNANLLQSSATTTNSNSGNLIVKRNSASLLRLDHTLWSSPVASQNLYNFSPLTLMNRFYTYNTVSNGYVTTGLDATTTFAAGKGYAVRAPNDHSALTPTTWEGTFTGIPNNGTVPFTLDTNGSGFNLVGNPYPSPITATSFLTENSSKIGGTLYFYAHSLPMNADGTFPTGTNYSTWNASATTVATTATSPDPHLAPEVPNGIIQVGQGFFVKATAAGTINFTNTMRVANNANQFFRTTEIERHRLWLNLTTESGDDINQIAVAYVEGATQNADTNFDGLSFGNAGSMLSSKIDGSDYVIQGRSLPFASNDMVTLGFKATAAGNYKIVLTDKDGLFLGNQDVFVRDNLMGIEHNIKVSPYTFASEIGTFDTRFQLVYTQTLEIPSTTFTPNAVIVYKNTDGFHVTTNGIVMKDILVYDISGRLIFKQSNINGTTTVLKGLLQTKQVLLLKITSQENETVTVKAIN